MILLIINHTMVRYLSVVALSDVISYQCLTFQEYMHG